MVLANYHITVYSGTMATSSFFKGLFLALNVKIILSYGLTNQLSLTSSPLFISIESA